MVKVEIKGKQHNVEANASLGQLFCKLEYDKTVIGALVDGDLQDLYYEIKENHEAFYKAPTNKEVVHKTFCGT